MMDGFITREKLRAARNLKDWTQEELSEKSGISLSTIRVFEQGKREYLSVKHQLTIVRTFAAHGIEIGESHIGFIRNEISSYVGKDGFARFFDDVYATVKDGGEVRVSNVNENDFLKWEDERADLHTDRMKAIKGLDFKILVEEGDSNLAAADYAEYRYLPSDKFSDIPLYIYGDKAAIIVFEENHVEIFVIKQLRVAEYFKKRFMLLWPKAQTVK